MPYATRPSRSLLPSACSFLVLVASASLAVGDTPAAATSADTPFETLRRLTFAVAEVTGIGFQPGVCRRDPSDVIRVGENHYVWYTKVTRDTQPASRRSLYPSGYLGEVWYATSADDGHTWVERGQALSPGPAGAFDAFGVFTPNILWHDGKYYLYYTAVRPTPGRQDGLFENNSTNDFTAIGVAVADAPDGPFRRAGDAPVLSVATDRDAFDSYRVDDAALLVRDNRIWLYYKGRSLTHGRQGPRLTRMGLAIADHPAGPFARAESGQAILAESHEVLVWRQPPGVAALASISRTLQYAADGIHFQPVKQLDDRPQAPGAFRADISPPSATPRADTRGIAWGIAMRHGPHPYLVRFDCDAD